MPTLLFLTLMLITVESVDPSPERRIVDRAEHSTTTTTEAGNDINNALPIVAPLIGEISFDCSFHCADCVACFLRLWMLRASSRATAIQQVRTEVYRQQQKRWRLFTSLFFHSDHVFSRVLRFLVVRTASMLVMRDSTRYQGQFYFLSEIHRVNNPGSLN